jgi:uncharacterized membrane protein YeaQ/YmgE (transglycosylase-associated protein family)
MNYIAWALIGMAAGWLANNAAEHSRGFLSTLLAGTVFACVGGYVLSWLFGFRVEPGFSTASALLAALAAGLGLFAFVSWPRTSDPNF